MKLTDYQRRVLKAADRGGLRRSKGEHRYVYITDPNGSWRAENVRRPTLDKLFEAGLVEVLAGAGYRADQIVPTDAGREALSRS
jgi:hypothetical protein